MQVEARGMVAGNVCLIPIIVAYLLGFETSTLMWAHRFDLQWSSS